MAMKEPNDDDYLWDKSGAPDEVVVALEELLEPLGHSEDAVSPASPRRGGGRTVWPILAVAAALLLAAGWALWLREAPTPAPRQRMVTEGNEPVVAEQWLVVSDTPRVLTIGDVGEVVVAPESRLRLQKAGAELVRLELASGALEARITADARPRFFQVATPASTVVDLGCRYTLRVTDGVANVRVISGLVAFESSGRETIVPAGATCRAWPKRGAGTPRFERSDAALRAALDVLDEAWDAPTAERERKAKHVFDRSTTEADTLALWHLSADANPSIARGALARAARRA